ncbi:efflux RND transporter permease subunit [Halomonas sp. MCCC 1A17488]|uniref:efflux RND transporter permease subunit n=1 Tax=unclassified Halomonas TaxID=2609666 RepID=UPI0018D21D0D|nr:MULTISPECIES: efflux RND transporter permease subunit [unclassified Halomonas]MCE8015837.1 efflux RND transporter permease subunit [Halomonas sp. MCCC 1A17488]MCG3239170.1 efflux RND transporter permease subunit [Halomonas sp. MCCC 1A17488]QPP50890.1 efflux RND transporter permease subunit [Halomonas sp. SS10-MC5]
MSWLLASLRYKRLILSITLLLALLGLAAWVAMDRQEDPFFPYRFGQVLVPYPGAEPEQVERLVLNPLEEELAQIEEVNDIIGTSRLGVAHVTIEMHEHVYDTDAAWERVRIAVDRASREFPDGVGEAEISDRDSDAHGIVLAVTGSDDLLELREAAKRLRRDLFRLKEIARIDVLADPGQQVVIGWDDTLAELTGLDARALGDQLAARNLTSPGGSLSLGGRALVLDPRTEFGSLEELADTPIRTRRGDQVPLGELADVHLAPQEPATERLWHDGRPAVALGLVLANERVNAARFGERLRALVEELRPAYAPLAIEETFYQPRWVERRLAELGVSLLLGIGILGVLLFLAMGLRLGLAVMVVVPLVTFSSLALYAMGGGVLHQIAVAGMVIALGMLVDNAIVMVENIQWHRDQGRSAAQAVTRSVRELTTPLLAATGTTLAAFVPLLLSSGNTADFTRAIPIMVMLTLAVSYVYAVFVTPVFAAGILKPRLGARRERLQAAGGRLGRIAVRWPAWVLAGAGGLLVGALAMMPLLDQDFFPDTDRNQLVVDLNFPEGTHLDTTAHQAEVLATALAERPAVQAVHRFVGFSGPRFYYNLVEQPRQPHLARLVVEADDADDLAGLMAWVRAVAPERLPEAEVVARRLGQGPPLEAPVEIRVFGEDRAALAEAAARILSVVREAEGARDARHRLGEGLATLRVETDDARAAEYGLSRRDVATALAGASRGVEVSIWRAGRDPAPLLVRSPEGERFSTDGLEGLRLAAADGSPVPLGEIASLALTWRPAVIQHRGLRRMTVVLAEVADGWTYDGVLGEVLPRLEALELPAGVSYAVGGAAESAGDANTALFQTLPFGGLLLVIFLLAQFNSFRQLAIVLTTVPLSIIGVVPGLWLTGQPFGFTAILGVVALVGIVVNNAIVLIDLMNANRKQGLDVKEAVVSAVARRTRPVLLTTATTVAGLVPLTLTQSTLWPPMAWAIISGLVASTLLTLLVIPALYRLLIRD